MILPYFQLIKALIGFHSLNCNVFKANCFIFAPKQFPDHRALDRNTSQSNFYARFRNFFISPRQNSKYKLHAQIQTNEE